MTRREIPITAEPHREREAALHYEIVQEQAAALGRLGRALEATLAALARLDRGLDEAGGYWGAPDTRRARERTRLVRDAGRALWCFMVQREACGLRDERQVIREYRVPGEVLNCMGIFGAG